MNALNIGQIATILMPVIIGATGVIAVHHLRQVIKVRKLQLAIEVLKEIKDELFMSNDETEFLRHKVFRANKTLTLEEYAQMFPEKKDRLTVERILMAHDRFAFFIELSGREANPVYEWQKYEIIALYSILKHVIADIAQNKPEGFCQKLVTLAQHGPKPLGNGDVEFWPRRRANMAHCYSSSILRQAHSFVAFLRDRTGRAPKDHLFPSRPSFEDGAREAEHIAQRPCRAGWAIASNRNVHRARRANANPRYPSSPHRGP